MVTLRRELWFSQPQEILFPVPDRVKSKIRPKVAIMNYADSLIKFTSIKRKAVKGGMLDIILS